MNLLRLLFAVTLIASSAGVAAQAPSDAQIASIVVVANQVDVDAGHLANTKWRITSRCSMRATRR
jgi:putative membrane protein